MDGNSPHQLNYFEFLWVSMYEGRDPLIVTGIFSFLVHEVVYFGRFVPFLICDFIPYFQRYKLQPDKENKSEDYLKCTIKVLKSHFLFQSVFTLFFYPIATQLGMRISVPFPGWQQMCVQIAWFFVFEDFFNYHTHRVLHWPQFYKEVHKVHHEFAAPFGITAEYAHPIELTTAGFGTIGGPLIYHAVSRYLLELGFEWDLHLATMLVWIAFRLIQAIDSHSGYDFPWSLHHWLPFWAGAEHHDYHHLAFVGNYSSSFRWWDYFYGTDVTYRAYRNRQADKLNKLKTKSQ